MAKLTKAQRKAHHEAETTSAEKVETDVLASGLQVSLVEGLYLRRSEIMGIFRIEIVGFHSSHVKHLRLIGCETEAVQCQIRILLPLQTSLRTLERMIEHYPQAWNETTPLAA